MRTLSSIVEYLIDRSWTLIIIAPHHLNHTTIQWDFYIVEVLIELRIILYLLDLQILFMELISYAL